MMQVYFLQDLSHRVHGSQQNLFKFFKVIHFRVIQVIVSQSAVASFQQDMQMFLT